MNNELKILSEQEFVDALYASSWLLSVTMSNYSDRFNSKPTEDKIYQQLRVLSRIILQLYEYSNINMIYPTQYDVDDRDFIKMIISKYGQRAYDNNK